MCVEGLEAVLGRTKSTLVTPHLPRSTQAVPPAVLPTARTAAAASLAPTAAGRGAVIAALKAAPTAAGGFPY